MTKRLILLLAATALVGQALTLEAQAQVCDPPGAAVAAGLTTVAAVNGFTTSALVTEELVYEQALKASTEEITGNIQAAVTAQGLITEAKSNQDTQRLVQSDAVAAQHNFAVSLTLCQGATQSTMNVALEAATVPNRIVRSDTNGNVTSGVPQAGDSAPPSQSAAQVIKQRAPLFCDPNDPVCIAMKQKGTFIKNGDRKPGLVFAIARLDTPEKKTMATALVQNLTQPARVPAMTLAQVNSASGQDAYVRRGSYETMINLAKDIDTDLLYTRRDTIGDATTFNHLAAEGGLPTATSVSLVDIDRMRYRDRFNANYHSRVQNEDPASVDREIVGLLADKLQQGLRTNELLEQDNIILGSTLSLLVENKIQPLAGTMR